MNDQHAPHRRSLSSRAGLVVAFLGAVVLALVLAACRAGGGPGAGGGPEADGGGDGGESGGPTGSELVLRVETAGGFVPREYALSAVPELTILADGRVITVGPQILIYPGPVLPNVQQRRLTESGVGQVVARVLETGYFDASTEFMGAANFVADAGTTSFILDTGRTVTVSVYGLGTVDRTSAEMLPEEELAAHETLQALHADLLGLETWLPAEAWAEPEYEQYVPGALRVYVREPGVDEEQPEGIEPERREWPLAAPLAELGEPLGQDAPDLRCGVVSGAEVNQLLDALSEANTLTRWQSGGSEYVVVVRPLLPDEAPDCG